LLHRYLAHQFLFLAITWFLLVAQAAVDQLIYQALLRQAAAAVLVVYGLALHRLAAAALLKML
jgi:hypothetical protein